MWSAAPEDITITAPTTDLRNGQRIGFTIRDESGGALSVSWSGWGSPPWTSPASGHNRSVEFSAYYSDFCAWRQLWYSGADVPN